MMRIQFVSDLHLEFAENRHYLRTHPLPVVGDVLLIAGDTAYLDLPGSAQNTYSEYDFWDWASGNYQQVIVCFGNHDFYNHYDLAAVPDNYCYAIRPNVRAYYNAVIHLADIDIIVSTLWGHIEQKNEYITQRGVSDFYRILYNNHPLTAYDFNCANEQCVAFIRQAVAASIAKTKIVLTHHVPSALCVASEYRNSPINGAFVTDLSEYILQSNINYWIYGHSHRNIDTRLGNTLVLSNQLGYVAHEEHLTNHFTPSRFIEI